ncbi:MAG: hypothetical protein ACRCVV_22175 [Shewanella sp.]|uniref:hypothetical protein n=1 Tax=Aeromonas popoffii TaxID=70856 RepID=UPI003F389E79
MDTAKHISFVSDITKHGADAALILARFRHFLELNKADARNIHDDSVWTFGSAESLVEYHPYFNAKKIARILSKLEADGVLVSGNYNRKKYDRTKWYTIKEPAYFLISQKWEMHCSEMGNAFPESVQPIPDIDSLKESDVDVTTGLFQQAEKSALTINDSNESSSDTAKQKDGLAEKEMAGPLASELGDDFPYCKTAVGIMNKLRREEGLTALYTSRMKREQWARCEANLDGLFADNATEGDLESFIFEVVEGKLKNLPRITLNHIAATYWNEDSLGGDIVGHITDHHGIDGESFAY